MKKLLTAIVSGAVLTLAVPAISFATPEVPPATETQVTGTVYKNGNTSDVVPGATVSVTCDGHTAADVLTDSEGAYRVDFAIADCPDGATAQATATAPGGLSGSNSGKVSNVVPDTLNIGVVDVNVVPELGLAAAAGAAIIGGGAFMVVRQRKLNHQA